MLPTLCGIIAAPPPYSSVLVDGAVELITVALAPSPPEAAQQIHAAATPAMLQVGRQPWQEGPGRPSFQQRIEAPRHALCSELGLGLPKGVHAACPGSTVHRRLPFMPPGQRASVLSAAHCCRCTHREHRRWPAFTPALVAPAHRPCSSCRSPCSWCCVMTTARCCAAPQRTCAPCCRCSAGAWGSGCPSPVLRPAPFERMNRPGEGQSGGARGACGKARPARLGRLLPPSLKNTACCAPLTPPQVGGSAALTWPGLPSGEFLPALLLAVQRLLQPGLEDRAASLVGSLILELLRHAGPQMVRGIRAAAHTRGLQRTLGGLSARQGPGQRRGQLCRRACTPGAACSAP